MKCIGGFRQARVARVPECHQVEIVQVLVYATVAPDVDTHVAK